jgi:hypothetical protein
MLENFMRNSIPKLEKSIYGPPKHKLRLPQKVDVIADSALRIQNIVLLYIPMVYVGVSVIIHYANQVFSACQQC